MISRCSLCLRYIVTPASSVRFFLSPFFPLSSRHHRFYHTFVGPKRQIEQWVRPAAKSGPVDVFHVVKIGRPEIERASVEHDGSPALVYLPSPSTIDASLSAFEKVLVQIDTAKPQCTLSCYYKFLVHVFLRVVKVVPKCAARSFSPTKVLIFFFISKLDYDKHLAIENN